MLGRARGARERLLGDLIAGAARIVRVLHLAADTVMLRLGAARVLGSARLQDDPLSGRAGRGDDVADLAAIHSDSSNRLTVAEQCPAEKGEARERSIERLRPSSNLNAFFTKDRKSTRLNSSHV